MQRLAATFLCAETFWDSSQAHRFLFPSRPIISSINALVTPLALPSIV
jgi:hypothetical protein